MTQSATQEEIMYKAAEMRVQGKAWEDIAEAVERAPETVRQWQYRRTRDWNKALLRAIDNSLPTYEHEALTRLRKAVRSKDTVQSVRAAKALLQHARELRGTKQEITHKTDASGVTFQVVYPDEENDSDD